MWCSRLQVLNLRKFVTAREPGVSEDLLETALGAKPLTRFFLEKLLNQVLELWCTWNSAGPPYICPLNVLIQHVSVLVEKGSGPCQHLKEQDADGPPVNALVVALIASREHLGCHVLARSRVCHGYLVTFKDPCHTIVNQL